MSLGDRSHGTVLEQQAKFHNLLPYGLWAAIEEENAQTQW